MSPPSSTDLQEGRRRLIDVEKPVSTSILSERFEDLSVAYVRQENHAERQERNEDVMFFPLGQLNFNDLYDFQSSRSSTEFAQMKKLKFIRNDYKSGKIVKVNKKEIAIFRYGEKVFAIDEKCPHVGGPLHLGDIENLAHSNILCVVCPWHKWKIELETGKLKVPQKPKQTNVYPVKVLNDGSLSIGFHKFCPEYFLGDDDF